MRRMFAVCLLLLSPCVALAIEECVPLAITEAELDEIAGKLFNMPPDDTNHDYNYYRCCPDPDGDGTTFCHDPIVSGYKNGHSGWDLQTKSVVFGIADEPFYSLTAGEVIRAGGGNYNTIAVYSCADNRTTLYLHARRVDVLVGDFVKVGDPLGIQGNKGLHPDPTVAEHVHIEVQEGRSMYSSPGAGRHRIKTAEGVNKEIKTIDPIPYLHEWVTSIRGKYLPVDVNRDGQVDNLDYFLVLIAWWWWETYPTQYDVNCDGEVNGEDLDIILDNFTVVLAAPAASNPPVVETHLLPNYPNPFNPETWIPYQLASAADVKLTIYDMKGELVRRLDLGYQPAGYYTDRAKAAYWDGRNESGESVASGIYFYQLRAGESIYETMLLKG